MDPLLRKEDFTHKDTERLAASFAVAMGVHIMLFLIFSFVKWDANPPQPELTGPVYVTLNTPELDSKDKLSITKTEKIRTKPVVEPEPAINEPPKEELVKKESVKKELPKSELSKNEPAKTAIPAIKPNTVPPAKQAEQQPVNPENRETAKVQKAEPPVTKPETREHQVPRESEKYTYEERKTGEDAQQASVSGVLESGNLSALEKVLDQSNTVNGYSGKIAESKKGTVNNNSQTGKTTNRGGAGRVEWEDPGEDRAKLYYPEPVIPDWVGKQGIQLKAIFSFLVTPEGYLTNIKLIKSCGYTDVDQAIASALAHWQFEPTASNKLAKATIPYTIQPN